MGLQKTMQVRAFRKLELNEEEIDCLNYLLKEFQKWKRLKNPGN